MTTKVTIDACCADDEEVRVIITDNGSVIDTHVLQNGETESFYIYGEKFLLVQEFSKD